jgi:TRAP-type C4-dicarboxylate transport system substrate-binding protein
MLYTWPALKRALLVLSTLAVTIVPLQAYELRLGSAFNDVASPFGTQFGASLKDTSITVVHFKTRVDVVDALVSGSVDAGMVTTEAILLSHAKEKPTLAPLMGSPLQFASEDELFKIQQSVVREAIFADVGRSEIVPIEFWSAGHSYLISRKAISSLESLKGLSIAPLPFGSRVEFIKQLGAEPITDSNPDVAIQTGKADAAEFTPEKLIAFLQNDSSLESGSLVRGFRPLIGFLALSDRYYFTTSEVHRSAIRVAANDAKLASQKSIWTSEKEISNLAEKRRFQMITPDRFDLKVVKAAADEAYIVGQEDRKRAEQEVVEYDEWIRLAKGLDEKKR